MEINGSNPSLSSNCDATPLQVSPQPAKAKEDSVDDDAARMKGSVRSRGISNIAELIRSTPDVRESKIEQVRKRLDDGNYDVKAEKIAKKIIEDNLLDKI